MDIDPQISEVIFKELGKNGLDIFVQFFAGSPLNEQVDGARDILTIIVGGPRTDELLKNFSKNT